MIASPRSVSVLDLQTARLPAPRDPGASLRLLDVTKYFGRDSGGIKTYLTAKAEWLRGQPGVSQVLVIPGAHDGVSDGPPRTYQICGPRMPGQRTYRWLLDTRKLRRILEHERPTLIEIGSALLVPAVTRRASRGLDIPAVWFYHTHLPRMVNPAGSRGPVWRRLAEALAWWHIRRTAGVASATFAASETIAVELERHGVQSVRRVRLGVDLERFHPDRRMRGAELRQRLQLPAGPLAVFAGRFTPEKKLETVLAAWSQVRARTGAALVLLGHGPLESSLRSRFSQDGIFWRPFETDRSRVADLLAAADCYIAPGPAETFGLSALEALASGTPLLSVDAGGAAELAANSGAGRLYHLGDVAGCVTHGVDLLGGAAASLRIPARAYAESRHAWPVVLADLLSQYRSVLSAASLAVR